MHNNAPAHFSVQVHALAHRSQDLNSLDYLLRGHLKSFVYSLPIQTARIRKWNYDVLSNNEKFTQNVSKGTAINKCKIVHLSRRTLLTVFVNKGIVRNRTLKFGVSIKMYISLIKNVFIHRHTHLGVEV